MRFNCHFLNLASEERRTIVASLTLAKHESVDRLRKRKGTITADITSQAYALRRAYAEVPNGFLHICPPELIAEA